MIIHISRYEVIEPLLGVHVGQLCPLCELFIYQAHVLLTSGGKLWKSRLFSIERRGAMRNALSEWEWKSVKVNKQLLKYLPRPVGRLQGNHRCYSGKLADTQHHLVLIIGCTCTSAGACARINTHQQICRCTQTTVYNCIYCMYTPRSAYKCAVISHVPQGAVQVFIQYILFVWLCKQQHCISITTMAMGFKCLLWGIKNPFKPMY